MECAKKSQILSEVDRDSADGWKITGVENPTSVLKGEDQQSATVPKDGTIVIERLEEDELFDLLDLELLVEQASKVTVVLTVIKRNGKERRVNVIVSPLSLILLHCIL